jgi:ABC-type multidrug transport system fused ATPase/permease subunit
MVRIFEKTMGYLVIATFIGIVVLAGYGAQWGVLDFCYSIAGACTSFTCFIAYWVVAVVVVWYLFIYNLLLCRVIWKLGYIFMFLRIFRFNPTKAIPAHAKEVVRADIKKMKKEFEEIIKKLREIESTSSFYEGMNRSLRNEGAREQYKRWQELQREKKRLNGKMWDAYDVAHFFHFVPRIEKRHYSALENI